MNIDTHNIANLARISLTEEEHVAYSKDIQSIFELIDTIQSQSVSEQAEQSSFQSVGMAPVGGVRIDEIVQREGEYTPEELVAQAPQAMNGYIQVKKILQQ